MLQDVRQHITADHHQATNHATAQTLIKAYDVVHTSLDAVGKVLNGPASAETHHLASIAQGVVAEAAQSVVAPRVAANGSNPSDAAALRAASVNGMAGVIQPALEIAVSLSPLSNSSDILVAATQAIADHKPRLFPQPLFSGPTHRGLQQVKSNPYPPQVSDYV